MAVKAFISYSHKDRKLASIVKERLEQFGISAFLAHDDIRVSQEWRDRILNELDSSDIFVPLLSESFKASNWAPQEVGIAVGRKKVLIVPLSLDGTTPFGFIEKLQGKKFDAESDNYEILIEPILARFPHSVIPVLIQRMSEAYSYRSAESLMLPLVSLFDKFNKKEAELFLSATINNNQIWDAADCKIQYLPAFIKANRTKIDKKKLAELRKLIE